MFPVQIFPEALAQLISLLKRKGQQGDVIRLGVKGGGCSGLEYLIKIESKVRDSDIIANFENITVVCDPKSAQFLNNSELKWTGNLMQGGFQFENPNAEKSCGCGTSFTPKKA